MFQWKNSNALLNDSSLNLFLGKNRPELVTHWFLFKSETSNILCHFKELQQVRATRVMNTQISMIHTKSGIQCVIAFDSDQSITHSDQIITRYNSDPLCKRVFIFCVDVVITFHYEHKLLNRIEIGYFLLSFR